MDNFFLDVIICFIMKKYLIVLLGILSAFLIYFGIKFYSFYNKIYIPKTKTIKENKPETKEIFNILLLGYGGKGHDGAYLTDTIILLHINIKNKTATLISIPRDIRVKIDTKSGSDFHTKINALFQIGLVPTKYPDVKINKKGFRAGADLLKNVVVKITGQKIDNFIAVDFSGFEKAVDMIGGIKINVERAFDDYEYPIKGRENDLCGKTESDLPKLEKIATKSPVLAFPCRYEHLHFDKGEQIMNGERALKYVRSRHSLQDGTDFGRARRQQLFLEAVESKILSIGFIPEIIPLMNELQNHIRTDLSLSDIKRIAKELRNANDYKLNSFVLSTSNYLKESYSPYGSYILIPKGGEGNWLKVKQAINNAVKGLALPPTLNPTNVEELNKN